MRLRAPTIDDAPAVLGAAQRTEQLVAHEFGRHSDALIDDVDEKTVPIRLNNDRDRCLRCFDRVVDQVGDDGIERVGIDRRAEGAGVILQEDFPAMGRASGFDQAAEAFRGSNQSVVAFLAVRLQALQKARDLVH